MQLLETSLQNLETLQTNDTHVQVVTTRELREILATQLKQAISIPYIKQSILYFKGEVITAQKESTKAEPAAIFESGAGPCSLVVAYDTHGQAKVLHLTQFNAILNGNPSSIDDNNQQLLELRSFMTTNMDRSEVLVTATNVSDKLRTKIVASIATALGLKPENISQIFLKSKPLQYLQSSLLGLKEDLIHSVLFIPYHYTQTNKNILYIIGDSHQNLFNIEDVMWLNRTQLEE